MLIFNLTAEVELQFTRFRAAFSLVSLLVVYIPSSLLCIAVIAAVASSKTMCYKTKTITINVLASSLALLATEVFRMIIPFLYFDSGTEVTTHCKVGIYFYFVTTESTQLAIFLYCLTMLYIVKKGIAQLKWSLIILAVVAPKLASAIWNQMVFYNAYFITGEIGFCFVLRHSTLLIVKLVSLLLEGVVFTGGAVACAIFLGIYVRENLVHTDQNPKKGTLRTSIALVVISIASLVTLVLPVLITTIQPEPTVTDSSTVWRKFLPQAVLFPIGSWPTAATPICMALTLRTVRDAFVGVFRKCLRIRECSGKLKKTVLV